MREFLAAATVEQTSNLSATDATERKATMREKFSTGIKNVSERGN
jgi:hypothetical protein